MTGIREKLGRATQTSDMGDRAGVFEVDSDRVGALGMAGRDNRLGAAIIRWVAANQDTSFLAVVEQLVLEIEDRFGKSNPNATLHVALQACREFSHWGCLECTGRGEIVSGSGLRFTCPECGGSKLRRYHDGERADIMRVSLAEYRATHAKRLSWALDVLHRYDHEIRRVSRHRLGY